MHGETVKFQANIYT